MKKLLSIFIALIISFSLAYAQENDDSENQFLPSFDDEDDSGFFDALEDSNEIIAQESERIAQEDEEAEQKKQRARARKKENHDSLSYVGLGANIPFNLNTEAASGDLYDTPIPLGISLHLITSYKFVTAKTDFNWDFVKYTEDDTANFLWTVSLGITPIHNDICFIGFYGTLGFTEEIEKYSYISYGISVNALYNFSDRFGLFVNLDATYRGSEEYKGDEAVASYIPRYLDTWRICPSIGFFYNFIKW